MVEVHPSNLTTIIDVLETELAEANAEVVRHKEERLRLRGESLRLGCERDEALAKLDRLRAAIIWWPHLTCDQWCATRADAPCNCGRVRANKERAVARDLIGIEQREP